MVTCGRIVTQPRQLFDSSEMLHTQKRDDRHRLSVIEITELNAALMNTELQQHREKCCSSAVVVRRYGHNQEIFVPSIMQIYMHLIELSVGKSERHNNVPRGHKVNNASQNMMTDM